MSTLDLQGVVFDVDGVLFDTERLSQHSWESLALEWQRPDVAQAYLEVIGRNRTGIRTRMAQLFGTEFPTEDFLSACSQRTQAHIEAQGVPLKPGVREVLNFLKDRNIPTGLATSTGRERTLRRLELAGLTSFFSAVITGDQVERGKPEPDIYLLACAGLKVVPGKALAVEDSGNGIRAAARAGMQVVMVPDLIPPTPELDKLLLARVENLHQVRRLLEQLL